ncbi:hypothetical protein TNCV_333541 [Trichonephila clavipes]|nr:hypothetical protein TNCV_333541 [Trichonephila clavipes]
MAFMSPHFFLLRKQDVIIYRRDTPFEKLSCRHVGKHNQVCIPSDITIDGPLIRFTRYGNAVYFSRNGLLSQKPNGVGPRQMILGADPRHSPITNQKLVGV